MEQRLQFWLAFAVAFVAMEVWSLVVHRWLWHGPLWWGHRSHHEHRDGFFEKNDSFALVHAAIAAPLIYFGLREGWTLATGVGFGMTAFGACYAIVHDGLVHGRLPVGWLAAWPWLRKVRNAHRAHHARDDGAGDPHRAPYGLFLGPWELRREQARRQARSRAAAPDGGSIRAA
ncbi:MAG: sterol desaturase family protein [Deltaproteobacteria bacterium]|nr:sterol desaturase family protein [Deltaproteobacteria bacterium]